MYNLEQSEFAHPPFSSGHVWSRRQLHVSDACLSQQEFARHQRRSSERDLSDLVWQCWDQYRYAHHLIRPGASLPDWDTRRSALDLSRLFGPWDEVCVLYRRLVFDPQIDLFEEQTARELTRWYNFQRQHCFEPILLTPAYTLCILQNAGVLDTPEGTCRTCRDGVFERLIHNINDRYNCHERSKN